jgi:hypothetical protein
MTFDAHSAVIYPVRISISISISIICMMILSYTYQYIAYMQLCKWQGSGFGVRVGGKQCAHCTKWRVINEPSEEEQRLMLPSMTMAMPSR